MAVDDSITSADVQGRTRVGLLALTDPREALELARAIKHPWYRCQSLAKVADYYSTKKQRLEILREALNAAQTQKDINRVVSVSAWPRRIMAPFAVDEVAKHLNLLVKQANSETHSLRRADALFVLANAVEDDLTLLTMIMPSLVRALFDGHGWRIDRLIRRTVNMVKRSMPEVLEQLVAHHSDGGKKQLLMKRIAEFSDLLD